MICLALHKKPTFVNTHPTLVKWGSMDLKKVIAGELHKMLRTGTGNSSLQTLHPMKVV